jgi:hypothetical protein
VGNTPTAFLALIAELAAAGFPEFLELELELCPWWRVASTAATTAPAITKTATGTPNMIHFFLLGDVLGFGGVMYPVDEL